MSYLRIWDAQAAARPDILLANSQFTEARIKKYYRREAQVIYPGALVLFEKTKHLFSQETKSERSYFLVVSRLTRSKKIDAVIEAFNKLALPLVVVGGGPEQASLEKIARKDIRFMGFVDDEALARLYRGARAVIFPSEEDFGMVAVEALSFGTPVIALEYGGIREIVTPGETGEFFHAPAPEIIAEGVRRFLVGEGTYSEEKMRASVVQFTKENFQKQLRRVLEN